MLRRIVNSLKINKVYYFLAGIILYTLIIFYPNFSLYFHQDDFFNFGLSNNLAAVISAFNIFQAHPDFPFYRPIPVQLYFYVLRNLLGFNPQGYHLANYALFALLILLVFRLILKFTNKRLTAIIATVIFAINSTHFAAMASGAYAHEIIFSIFSVLTIYFFLPKKNTPLSLFFLILALMSKEIAVMLPPILSVILFLRAKSVKQFFNRASTLLPFFLILGVYLIGHFVYYGLPQSSSYQFILGKQNLNILAWYTLWAFSVPNILIDFIGPGLKINPTFSTVAQLNGTIFVAAFSVFVLSAIFLFLKTFEKLLSNSENLRIILIGLAWFVLGLIPVLIFPLHKLAIEQTFPMIGLILSVSMVISVPLSSKKFTKFIAILAISAYLILATNSIYLARRTHWIVRSANQAKAVIDFLRPKINSMPVDSIIYFADGEIVIPEWGSSKQMYLALSEGRAINIIFNRPDLTVRFASQNDPVPTGENSLILNSSQFLGY